MNEREARLLSKRVGKLFGEHERAASWGVVMDVMHDEKRDQWWAVARTARRHAVVAFLKKNHLLDTVIVSKFGAAPTATEQPRATPPPATVAKKNIDRKLAHSIAIGKIKKTRKRSDDNPPDPPMDKIQMAIIDGHRKPHDTFCTQKTDDSEILSPRDREKLVAAIFLKR